jgi:hypothetical protein
MNFTHPPPSSSPFCFAAALTMFVCYVLEAHFTCINLYPFFNVSSLMFPKLLIAHTTSRILDLPFVRKTLQMIFYIWKKFALQSNSVTGFTEDHA